MPSADIDAGSQQISCGEKLNGIPKFNNIEDHRQWIKEHMAACFRVMARQGFTEGLAGHISVRDPAEPHHFWMNPLGKHFAMMTASDMTMVDYDGNVLQGGSKTVNAAGFQIHSAIHKAHPHIHAACHAHGVNGRAWSVFGRPLDIMTQDHCIFYQAHSVYHNFGGVVFDKAEAERLAAALGPAGKGLILQNHGLLTVGHTADEATYLFTLMERLCEVQLKVDAVQGLKKVLVKDEVADYTKSTASSADDGYIEFQPEFEYELKLSKGELRE